MFNCKLTNRLFTFRTVEEVLSDAAAGHISVLPNARKSLSKSELLRMLNRLGENTETMAELLAGGDISRLQKYYSVRTAR